MLWTAPQLDKLNDCNIIGTVSWQTLSITHFVHWLQFKRDKKHLSAPTLQQRKLFRFILSLNFPLWSSYLALKRIMEMQYMRHNVEWIQDKLWKVVLVVRLEWKEQYNVFSWGKYCLCVPFLRRCRWHNELQPRSQPAADSDQPLHRLLSPLFHNLSIQSPINHIQTKTKQWYAEQRRGEDGLQLKQRHHI